MHKKRSHFEKKAMRLSALGLVLLLLLGQTVYAITATQVSAWSLRGLQVLSGEMAS